MGIFTRYICNGLAHWGAKSVTGPRRSSGLRNRYGESLFTIVASLAEVSDRNDQFSILKEHSTINCPEEFEADIEDFLFEADCNRT